MNRVSELNGGPRADWHLTQALAQLASFGTAIAVEECERQMDYATFAERMNRLAAELRSGYSVEAIIALDIVRSLELVLALCACLHAGRTFVIVTGAQALRRARAIGAKAIVRAAAEPASMALVVESLDTTLAGCRPVADDDADLAYLLYTSGSTGAPKAVELRRSGLSNYLAWAARHYGMDALRGAVAHLNPAFDAAITQLLLPIVCGRCVHIVPQGREITGLIESLDRLQGRWLVKLTPSQITPMTIERDGAGGFASAGELIFGGEALHGATQCAAAALFPGYTIHNEYGPTETVVGCTIYTAARLYDDGSLPIGAPIDATSIRVVDAALRPVPHGETGEILIGGAGVARGYRGLARLTAEAFVPDPAGGFSGARAYRSGDFGYIDADGHLRYTGRRDEQVKIRGHRVELGEVRERLQALPGVAEVAIEASSLPDGDRELRAYVRLKSATTLAIVRTAAQQALPEFLWPSHWYSVAQMPLTENGKLDKSALPTMVGETPPVLEAHDATTATVMALWSDLLQHEAFGPDDDFHAVGGHSLLAIRLRGQIRKQFGVSVPLAVLVTLSTPRRIAGAIDAAAGNGLATSAAATVPASPPSGDSADAPLSLFQQPLWVAALDARRRGLPDPYLVPVALRVHGALDLARLRNAFGRVIARHGVFYTRITWNGESARQRIGETPLWEWQVEAPADIALRLRLLATSPLDLETGPVAAVHVLPAGTDETVVLLRLHHLFIDEWSTAQLIDELSRAYNGIEALPAAPPRDAYAAFSRRQHAATTERLASQQSYWANALADAAGLPELPGRAQRGATRVLRRSATLDSAQTASLRAVAAAQQVSMHTLVLTAVGLALGQAADLPVVRIAVPMAVRDDETLHGVCGYFLNSVLYSVPVDAVSSLADAIKATGFRAIGVLENKDLPYEQVVSGNAPMASGAHAHVRFVYSEAVRLPEFDSCTVEYVPVERAGAKFPLLIAAQAGGDGLTVHLDADIGIYDESAVGRWAQLCYAMLAAIAQDATRQAAGVCHDFDGKRQTALEERALSLAGRLRGAGRRSASAIGEVAQSRPAALAGIHLVQASTATALPQWLSAQGPAIQHLLAEQGAVLFRDFADMSIEGFEACVGLLGQGAMIAYENRSTPRTRVHNHVYTSTEYAADAEIPLHSENAYSARWPARIMFWSRQVAERGGETPVADNRRVLAAIPAATRDRFASRGVMYLRNYHRGIGLSWQETFQTASRDEVESYCLTHGMQWRWLPGDVLRTWQVLPAVRTHAPTGAEVWFNQAHLFHVSSMGAAMERDLRGLFDEQSLPRNACFGDGSPIGTVDLAAIRDAYAAHAIVFPWRYNDLLVLDNALYSHGRRSYVGERRVLVGMTGPAQEVA
ncbi:AMP-binding protein [Tahibacter sp.]|uniref:non-ribosomal peptide synthetase n=1 Tax=Tahibacter sp. TaxID=2056211 RepID=UPI0028C45648|nr:AMP-binding protein [Tahibacter sp.]